MLTKIIFFLNIILILTMIFIERRKPERISAWALIMTLAPVFGFVFYVLIGGGLSFKTKRMIKKKQIISTDYVKELQRQLNDVSNSSASYLNEIALKYKKLLLFNANNNHSIYTPYNDVKFFVNANDWFEALCVDIKNAKKSIYVESYILANDSIGKKLIDLLSKKAGEGLDVKLVYDSVGSLHTGKKLFKKLKENGGFVAEFFPPLFNIKIIQLKANYRNHRKIISIDEEISYVGGMNFREDHFCKKEKLSPWIDAHIRIFGNATNCLQNILLGDFQYAYNYKFNNKRKYQLQESKLDLLNGGNSGIQIIQSGPHKSSHDIKDMYVKMICNAKKSIVIQTPYLMIDDTMNEVLKIALKSGVSVTVMIPKKPDKKIVYWATLSFARDLLAMGANIYFADGFLHSKTLIIDDEIMTIGSCNFDTRSFELNFEVNAVIYDINCTKKYCDIIKNQLASATQINTDYFEKLSPFVRGVHNFFRIFSPLM